MHLRDYTDFETRLAALNVFHMELGIERTEKALKALNLLPLPFANAQIVGTNGKGSTAHFLAAIAEAHGHKTGLFTSPHFVSPRERILINGVMLSEEYWVSLGERVWSATEGLTWFESLCLMAILAFTEQGVDFAVTEAGLGGRFDATTAMPADVVCFTPIGRDHLHVLGPELCDIVVDKAAALRAGMPAVTAEQSPLVLQYLTDASRRMDALLLPADENALPVGLRLRLAGRHQQRNAALAASAWTAAASARSWPIREDALRRGLENAFVPGRLQSVPAGERHPHLLLDGAHNAPACEMLRDALKQPPVKPCALIFSCMADKELEAMLPPLLSVAGDAPFLFRRWRTTRGRPRRSISQIVSVPPPKA